MNKLELIEILEEMADKDLIEGRDIYDHPCSVAIRALDKCFEDINILRRMSKDHVSNKSKKVQVLVKMNYEPEW